MTKTWLVTGSSRGLGRAIATTALERGDNVVLAARSPDACQDIVDRFPDRAVSVALDVTRSTDALAAVQTAEERFGRLDVVVNNAAFAITGFVEEVSREEYQSIFETNVFGAIETIRAALPALRRANGGRIVNISSIGGMIGSAGFGYYCSTKFALEGLSEALAQEVSRFGIAVIIVEPGRFQTEFLASAHASKSKLGAYQTSEPASEPPKLPPRGDPMRAAQIIAETVDLPKPPLRLPLGADAFERIQKKLAKTQAQIADWQSIGSDTGFRT